MHTEELIRSPVLHQVPICETELNEAFADVLSHYGVSKFILPDGTQVNHDRLKYTLFISKPGYGQIIYSPGKVEYTLPNDDFSIVETARNYYY